MNVTLRQLRVFRSVAEGRNFSRAGDQVGLTQPAVSRAILELESQLGLKLLDRTTREVTLTEAGQSLAARIDRVLDELDQSLQDVAGLASAQGGKVRVASSPTLSSSAAALLLATRPVTPAERIGTDTFSIAVRLGTRLNAWNTTPTPCWR